PRRPRVVRRADVPAARGDRARRARVDRQGGPGARARGGAPPGVESSGMSLDVEAARARFSALQRDLVFFDGPGGTQVPDEVIDAVADYFRTSNANTSGPYETSRRTEALLTQARLTAAAFLGCTPEE